MRTITREHAKQYIAKNISVIPARKDKAPALSSWKIYQERKMFIGEVNGNFPADAIGIVTGFNRLEVIDVDTKHDTTGTLWPDLWSLINDNLPDVAPRLVVANTVSGGKHIYYRCPIVEGNKKLASNSHNETLIETRGTGGYVIAPPSPGYTFLQGTPDNIPEITAEERQNLMAVCRSFDEVPPQPTKPPQPPTKGKNKAPLKYEGSSPFEDYDSRGDVIGLLQAHGWKQVKQSGDRIYFQRPGDTTAATSANFHTRKNRFYCFSTSSQFEAEKGYSPTDIFALLECRNDLSEASRRLYAEGYGERRKEPENTIDYCLLPPDEVVNFDTDEKPATAPDPTPQTEQTPDPRDKWEDDPAKIEAIIKMATIRPDEEIDEPEVCLSIKAGNRESIIGTLGNYSMIIGKAKSKKTFFVSIALAAAAKNSPVFGRFVGKLPPDKNRVVYVDTEQSRYHVSKIYKRVLKISGIEPDGTFEAKCFRKYSPPQRLTLIEHLIYNTPGLGLVVIDGIRDLVTSINDEEQATIMASKLLKWTEEQGIHIICVLHMNKGDDNARGHLGTELQNKAETVLSVKKDPENTDISIVEAEFCREIEPEPFAFEIDDYGLPRLVEDWHPVNKSQRGTKTISPTDFNKDYHRNLLTAVFFAKTEFKWAELISAIKHQFEANNIRFGDNKAKDFLNYYAMNGFIIKEGKDGSPKAFYKLME